MAGKLSFSPGSHLVSVEQLSEMPDPQASGPRHQPIRHDSFVNEVKSQCLARGYVVTKSQLAIDREGVRLFGALDLTPVGAEKLVGQDDSGVGMSIGIRHANDRTISVGMVAGGRVFVCDNLSFVGDIVLLRRKHTTNMHLDTEVRDALDRLFTRFGEVEAFHTALRDNKLDDLTAKQVIYDAFMERELLATAHMPEVHEWYFDAPVGSTDVRDRNAFGLYNAFTRTIKGLAPYRVQDTTVKVSDYFKEVLTQN